ncbi:MAG: hypothetical protein K2N23_05200 [Clostridia bacterium]|nr:hypothetical protein [Clostridia bacterium]
MKKNKFIILSLCALGAAAIGFTACGKDNVSDYIKDMKSSADRAVTVYAEIKLLDRGSTVYSFTRRMDIDTSSHRASITDVKTTLAEDFGDTTTTSTSTVENVTGETLIGLKLTKKLVSEYNISDGDLTCTVPNKKISEVLTKPVSASSDMTVFIDFENGNLTKAEYSYTNTSQRTVSVTVTYGY